MATRWRRRGRDLETLRRQLGHASMKTTQIYLTGDAVYEDAEILAFDEPVLPIEVRRRPVNGAAGSAWGCRVRLAAGRPGGRERMLVL